MEVDPDQKKPKPNQKRKPQKPEGKNNALLYPSK
jgi:hypothetical protein